MSADGKLALPDGRPVEISSEEDMVRVHCLRATCNAILVGVGTVVADDPKLHVNPMRVEDPPALTKVVLDATGRTPSDARLLSSPGPVVIATLDSTAPLVEDRLGDVAQVMACGPGPLVDLEVLMDRLVDMGVVRLIVEGGGETLWSFVSSGLVDEYSVYVGPMIIGGVAAPTPADGPGAMELTDVVDLELVSTERMGEGLWIRYRLRDPS
jgi:2,5-diamino-6-(ribosylamino)-4(3H)-pyrimidinone 5'-phosphate reductase